MKRLRPALTALVLAAIFLLPLSWRELATPDESRYSEIAREMLERNDWVTPYLNGVTYFEKPCGGYWLIAASFKIFGQNEFALRFPGMLATILSALCVLLLANRFSGENRDKKIFSRLAAGIFLASPLVFALGGIGVLDATFAFFMTLGMTLFLFAVGDENKIWTPKGVFFLFTCGLSFGMAFLVKGFLAFALPGSAIFFFMLIPGDFALYKNKKWWLKRLALFVSLPWIPLAGAAVISLPWSLAIHHAQPDFWRYFFYEEHIQRFMENKQHPKSMFYFLPVLLGGLAYILAFAHTAFLGFKKGKPFDTLTRYAACWFVFPFIFLSLSTGKLATYILPCFPAAAIIFAVGIYFRMFSDKDCVTPRELNIYLKILSYIAMGASALVFPVFVFAFKYLRPVWGDEPWKLGCIISALALFGVMLASAAHAADGKRKLVFCALAVLPVILCWQGVIPSRPYRMLKSPNALMREAKAKLGGDANPVLISYKYPFQAVCLEFGRSDVYMFMGGGELERGLQFMNDEKRILSAEQATALIESMRGKRPVLLVTKNYIREEEEANLPHPEWILSYDINNEDTFCVVKY